MTLKLTRPIASIDLETTGPFVGVDRIVDIAIVTLHPDGRVEEWQTLVNPEMPIHPSATAIHGITDEMVSDAPPLHAIADEVLRRLSGVDFTGYNVRRFDLPFLAAELDLACGFAGISVVDAMSIFHHFAPRDLEAAYRTYVGGDLEGAHRALPDARAALAVLQGQMREHADELPETPEAIVEFLRDKDAVDEDGKFKWYGDEVRVTFGKHRGHTLKWLLKYERGFLEWMLSGDFAEDTKAVARNALAGVMPKRETK